MKIPTVLSLAFLVALASSEAFAQRSTASSANDSRCCSGKQNASPEAEQRQRIIDQGLENARRYQETGNAINRQLEQLKEEAARRAEEERRREQERRDATERREQRKDEAERQRRGQTPPPYQRGSAPQTVPAAPQTPRGPSEEELAEDARAAERRREWARQQSYKIPPEAWTTQDTKNREPKIDEAQGTWKVEGFRVTAGGSNRMFINTYVQATIVDQHGNPTTQGGYVQIKNNSTRYPAYFGLSRVINDQLDPGEEVTLMVGGYRGPKDTAPTEAIVTLKYFDDAPKRKSK